MVALFRRNVASNRVVFWSTSNRRQLGSFAASEVRDLRLSKSVLSMVCGAGVLQLPGMEVVSEPGKASPLYRFGPPQIDTAVRSPASRSADGSVVGRFAMTG